MENFSDSDRTNSDPTDIVPEARKQFYSEEHQSDKSIILDDDTPSSDETVIVSETCSDTTASLSGGSSTCSILGVCFKRKSEVSEVSIVNDTSASTSFDNSKSVDSYHNESRDITGPEEDVEVVDPQVDDEQGDVHSPSNSSNSLSIKQEDDQCMDNHHERNVPITDILIRDQHIPNTDENIPNTDQNIPNTDQHIPNTDQNIPNTEQHIPNTDENISDTEQHISNTEQHISNTEHEATPTDGSINNCVENLDDSVVISSDEDSKQSDVVELISSDDDVEEIAIETNSRRESCSSIRFKTSRKGSTHKFYRRDNLGKYVKDDVQFDRDLNRNSSLGMDYLDSYEPLYDLPDYMDTLGSDQPDTTANAHNENGKNISQCSNFSSMSSMSSFNCSGETRTELHQQQHSRRHECCHGDRHSQTLLSDNGNHIRFLKEKMGKGCSRDSPIDLDKYHATTELLTTPMLDSDNRSNDSHTSSDTSLEDCESNKDDDDCESNKAKDDCESNKDDDECESNKEKEDCKSNKAKEYCESNKTKEDSENDKDEESRDKNIEVLIELMEDEESKHSDDVNECETNTKTVSTFTNNHDESSSWINTEAGGNKDGSDESENINLLIDVINKGDDDLSVSTEEPSLETSVSTNEPSPKTSVPSTLNSDVLSNVASDTTTGASCGNSDFVSTSQTILPSLPVTINETNEDISTGTYNTDKHKDNIICTAGKVLIKPSVAPSVKPTSVTPSVKPTSVTPSVKPTSVTPSVKPTSVTSSVKPTSVTSSVKPTFVTPSVKPTSDAVASICNITQKLHKPTFPTHELSVDSTSSVSTCDIHTFNKDDDDTSVGANYINKGEDNGPVTLEETLVNTSVLCTDSLTSLGTTGNISCCEDVKENIVTNTTGEYLRMPNPETDLVNATPDVPKKMDSCPSQKVIIGPQAYPEWSNMKTNPMELCGNNNIQKKKRRKKRKDHTSHGMFMCLNDLNKLQCPTKKSCNMNTCESNGNNIVGTCSKEISYNSISKERMVDNVMATVDNNKTFVAMQEDTSLAQTRQLHPEMDTNSDIDMSRIYNSGISSLRTQDGTQDGSEDHEIDLKRIPDDCVDVNTKSCEDGIEETCEYTLIEEPQEVAVSYKEFLSKRENHLRGCLWSPDGSRILTNSDDNILRLFKIPDDILNQKMTDELYAELRMPEGETVYDMDWYPYMESESPDTCCFLSTSRDHPIHLWDSHNGVVRCSYRAFDQMDELTSAHCVAFNIRGNKIYSGFDKCIRIFDSSRPGNECIERSTVAKKNQSKKGRQKCTQNQSGIISSIAFSGYCGMYALGSFNKTVGLYDVNDGKASCVLSGHTGGVTQVKFTSDGYYLISGARKDSEIIWWDLRNTSIPLFKLVRNVSTNQRIQFDIDKLNLHMFSGSTDNMVNIWDLKRLPDEIQDDVISYQPTVQFCAHNDAVNAVCLHPSKPLLASTSGQRHFFEDSDSDSTGRNPSSVADVVDNSLKIWLL